MVTVSNGSREVVPVVYYYTRPIFIHRCPRLPCPMTPVVPYSRKLTLTPAVNIVDNGISATAGDDPFDLAVAIVDCLMLRIRGDKSEVAWRKFLSLGTIGTPYNGTMSAHSVYNGV